MTMVKLYLEERDSMDDRMPSFNGSLHFFIYMNRFFSE